MFYDNIRPFGQHCFPAATFADYTILGAVQNIVFRRTLAAGRSSVVIGTRVSPTRFRPPFLLVGGNSFPSHCCT